MKTHDEIPGLCFVTNVSKKPVKDTLQPGLSNEKEAAEFIRNHNFPSIPKDAFSAILNPYQTDTWSIYVENQYEPTIKAWVNMVYHLYLIYKEKVEKEIKWKS